MKVDVKVNVIPLDIGELMDARGMTTIGNSVVTLIRKRTQADGESYDGEAFAPYSTRPIYISRNRGAGARLAPKGGRPSRKGGSVYYAGGYAEYKRLSTGSSIVNLTLSGQLMRSIRVAKADSRSVVVQAGGGAVTYARGVDNQRPFMGVAESERQLLTRVVQAQVKRVIKAAQAAQRGDA